MLKPLARKDISLGCDPEFFFSTKGEIIGAEKVIPKEGIKNIRGKIIIDGVQAEINPAASTCRAYLGRNISECFNELYQKIKNKKGLETNFAQTISVTKKEMDSLSPESKRFGCMPSLNIHNKKAKVGIKDPSKYMFRSAGGHIHVGITGGLNETDGRSLTTLAETKIFKEHPERIINMMDIIVGNTCVLIDRDEGNKERRKTYGRAGEYRKPEHGIEYRTLSNFWLKNYALMSLVMNLSRLAVSIVLRSTKENNYEKEIISKINKKEITKAINENDYTLARKNFDNIKQILIEITKGYHDSPFTEEYLPLFENFIKKGTDYWFKENPILHWIKLKDQGHEKGWESFLRNQVKEDIKKENINTY